MLLSVAGPRPAGGARPAVLVTLEALADHQQRWHSQGVFLRRKQLPTLSLWCVVDTTDLHLLASLHWRSWPQRDLHDTTLVAYRDRDEAVAVVRRELVPEQGEGSVVVFDVAPELETWAGVDTDSSRLRIPKGRRLTKAIVGDICEEAQYRRGVDPAEVDAVRDAFGELVPESWRSMVTAPCWLRRGWMATGSYVDLHTPAEAIRVTQSWMEEMVYHPGALVIGSDGAHRKLVIDLREDDPPVHLVEASSTGWDDTAVQAADLRTFAGRLEHGDFTFTS